MTSENREPPIHEPGLWARADLALDARMIFGDAAWMLPAARLVRRWLPLVIAAIAWQVPRLAAACSCRLREPNAEQLRTAAAATDAVFQGRVISRARVDDPKYGLEWRVVFAVQRSWSGAPDRRVVLRTPFNPPACGIRFHAGTRHLVFADRRPDGELEAISCGLTRPMRSAGEFLAVLGDGAPPRLDARGCAIGERPAPLVLLVWLALRRRSGSAVREHDRVRRRRRVVGDHERDGVGGRDGDDPVARR